MQIIEVSIILRIILILKLAVANAMTHAKYKFIPRKRIKLEFEVA